MEGNDDIVVGGQSGIWLFEVAVLTNQMSLASANSTTTKKAEARSIILKIIENARLYKLF